MAAPQKPADASDSAPPPDLRRLRLWQIQPVRDILAVAVILGVLYLGYLLRPVTVPLLLALALAYLVEPVVARLTRSGRLTRPFVAGCVIVVIALAVVTPIVVGGGFAVAQGARFADAVSINLSRLNDSVRAPEDQAARGRLPAGAWRWARDFLVDLRNRHPELAIAPGAPQGAPVNPEASPGGPGAKPPADSSALLEAREPTAAERWADYAYDWVQVNMPAIQRWLSTSLVGSGRDAFTAVWSVLLSVFYLGFTLFLTLFFFFFTCTAWGRVKEHIGSFVPERSRKRFGEVIAKMDAVIAAFIRGRLIISAVLMIEFSVVYWLIGVSAPLLVGIAVGVLSLVPYMALVGVPVCIGLLWLNPGPLEWQTTAWWVILAPVVATWLVQASDDYVWTPLIQGKATGMDTPTILFAVLAGATLAGIYGVMVAIPTAACVKIVIKEVLWPRFEAWAKGRSSDFLPISRE